MVQGKLPTTNYPWKIAPRKIVMTSSKFFLCQQVSFMMVFLSGKFCLSSPIQSKVIIGSGPFIAPPPGYTRQTEPRVNRVKVGSYQTCTILKIKNRIKLFAPTKIIKKVKNTK